MALEDIIAVGRGKKPADLVLRNAQVVDVISGEIFSADVALYSGLIVGFGDYQGEAEIDIGGKYVAPGFIDGHIHLESSLLAPKEFARLVVPQGTTTVICDPHELANVHGIEGINYILRAGDHIPMNLFVMLPSCVPATSLETSGAVLSSGDLALMMGTERVLGLAEMMNFTGVIAGDHEVLNKIRLAKRGRVDGHAPGLTGKDLNAYVDAGISSDHECTTREEAREKLRLGMYIQARESTTAKNLAEILPLVNCRNSRQFMLVRDDVSPDDLIDKGHVNYLLRRAVELGVDPMVALQMATLNPADYFGLRDLGAVAPGRRADLVVLEDLKKFTVGLVIKDGRIVAQDGAVLPFAAGHPDRLLRSSINFDRDSLEKLSVKAVGDWVKVIVVIPDQIVTGSKVVPAKVVDGEVAADVANDILKIAVVERHHASGNVGVGFVNGIGLKSGAIASSIAHDSHNLLLVGTNDEDMKAAALEIKSMRGGQVVVDQGKVMAKLLLPVAGLMSDKAADIVVKQLQAVVKAARSLGSPLPNPFMTLSFLALPVIPKLKITDLGLVDVEKSVIVPLFE